MLLMSTLAQAGAQGGAAHEHAHEHGRDRFRNPLDLEAYIKRQEEPERAAWQKPEQVVKALGIRAGQTVCDIGAGPGYWSLRISKIVGAAGHVYAEDVDARILDALRERIEKAHATNITPVLGLAGDPLLPAVACDLILVVDTYHHFPDRPAYLRGLISRLAPGGRIANIDFQKKETPVGPPLEHRVAREEFLRDATAAGLKIVAEHDFLENQYFLVLEPIKRPGGARAPAKPRRPARKGAPARRRRRGSGRR